MTNINISATDIATFDFIPGLPVDELHREIDVANTISSLGRRKLALYLGDMEERGVFALTGHSSAVHYAMTRLQLAKRRALELVRIGRQLGDLPEIDAALVAGDIGWSKLRYILRVVVPETQTEWLARADQSNCDVLSIDVARHVPGERPRQRNPGGLEDLFMTVRARLRLTNHEMWEQAKKKGYASHYTSSRRFGATSGKRLRSSSFRPCILTGASSPGRSNRHSFLSLYG